MKNLRLHKGFTLVELMTVVLVIGIIIAVFYMTFMHNWKIMDNYIKRADLRQEIMEAVGRISNQCRAARTLKVEDTSVAKFLHLYDFTGTQMGTFYVNNANQFGLVDASGTNAIYSENVDFTNSSFTQEDRGVSGTLVFRDIGIFSRDIEYQAGFEVYPRN